MRLEVLAVWLRGDADPRTPHYGPRGTRSERHVAWVGDEIAWRSAEARGSPFMLCGDRCMLFEVMYCTVLYFTVLYCNVMYLHSCSVATAACCSR